MKLTEIAKMIENIKYPFKLVAYDSNNEWIVVIEEFDWEPEVTVYNADLYWLSHFVRDMILEQDNKRGTEYNVLVTAWRKLEAQGKEWVLHNIARLIMDWENWDWDIDETIKRIKEELKQLDKDKEK